MLLTVRKRQEYLKELGYYKGEVDGKQGKLTKAAYLQLQKDYFTRDKDIDGKYGKNTDILLRSVYNCKDAKYFKVTEFKCKCNGKHCTGYPAEVNKNLVTYLDEIREKYGKTTKIISGLRCKKNNKANGGATKSRHLSGKATDIQITTISNTPNGRSGIVDEWIKKPNSRYAYCDDYARTKSKTTKPNVPTMGKSTHVDVK